MCPGVVRAYLHVERGVRSDRNKSCARRCQVSTEGIRAAGL